MNDFWTWSINKLSIGLRANEWYNNGQPYGLAGFMNDFSSRMVGYATLRQLRVKNSNYTFNRLTKLKINGSSLKPSKLENTLRFSLDVLTLMLPLFILNLF